MLLITHIFFALTSIPLMLAAVINELVGFVNNKNILPKLSALSFAGLVSTGTALIIINHLPVLGACLEGLLYLSLLAIPYVVFRKLATRSNN